MGGRGSSSGAAARGGGGGGARETKNIMNEFLQEGLNSKFPGIRKKAEEGTGNYAWKGAKAVSEEQALSIRNPQFVEKNGKTLIHGVIGETAVAFGTNSSNPIVSKIRNNAKETKERLTKPGEDLTIKTTTTYDRWRKQNTKKFDNWYKR